MFFQISVKAENDPNILVEQMIAEMTIRKSTFDVQRNILDKKIALVNQQLKNETVLEKKVNFLIEKDALVEENNALKKELLSDVSKIRYVKGLQIIKILYEKILALDHHFASVRTFSEISKMSTPNQYPEFSKVSEIIKQKRDKKSGFDLTNLLGSNPVANVVSTFSNLLVSTLSKEEKDDELVKIECILDFTLRMQTDLNTVYFETSFLSASNETIKVDLEALFKDYTKPIGYTTSMNDCRANDDWDTVIANLDTYLAEMQKADNTKKDKMQINVEFPIDRLIQFIGQYNAFIGQAEKFYQKFDIILNSYQNQKQCESKLPPEYNKLKDDVKVAIDKFNIAYKPVEINGSKMKEILYGINEF